MASTTIKEVCNNVAELELGDAISLPKGDVKKCALKFQGKPLSVQLNCKVAFEPSVYNGTGDEVRKGIVLRIADEDFALFTELEAWCKQALQEEVPNVDALWSPSTRCNDKYGSQLKAKITMGRGPYAVHYYDGSKASCDEPDCWRDLEVKVVLEVRGCYTQRTTVGMLLDVTHVQIEGSPLPPVVACPF